MAKNTLAQKSTGQVHVYSTLANPQKFVRYAPPPEDGMLPIIEREVLIRGGAGIASKNLITEHGVRTTISQEDYDAIKDLKHFKAFEDSGHIRVEGKLFDIDRIVGDMNPRDPGGPLTPADYETAAKDGSMPIPVDQEKVGSGWVLK